MQNRRSAKNLLLTPRLQLPFAIYSTLLAFAFVGASWFILYAESKESLNLIYELTDVGEDAQFLLTTAYANTLYYVSTFALIFILLNLYIGAYLSHKMVGPIVQFIKHAKALQQGDYSSRVQLRPNDGFNDLADELNTLAKNLEETKKQIN